MTSSNKAPQGGQKIKIENGVLQVPNKAVIPFTSEAILVYLK